MDPRDRPMPSTEVAARIGISIDTFYRQRGRMHVEEHMPEPITRHRPFKFHRLSMEAWLGRHHPLAQRAPAANEVNPQTIQQARVDLARAYGTR